MREIRLSIAVLVMLFICIGTIMIYSSSGVYAMRELGDKTYFLNRHLFFLFVGSLLMFGVMAVDYRELRLWAKPLMICAVILLVLVLIPGIGKASYGARRWFKLGVLSFQPSEFAKLTMLVYMADFLARKQTKISEFWNGFLPPIMILGVMCLLIIKQPDLGNCVLIASIVAILLYVAGAKVIHIAYLGVAALPFLYVLVVHVPYRWARIMAFLNPWEDSKGIGFQLTQSQIALGSGGLFGVGLGKSAQKLFYLPAAHTDFIFSIIGEELGLAGTLAVISLFVIFIWQGARLAKRVMDPFGHYLAVGIVAMLALQTVVNIGVSIGAMPTKGLPLPFISYGGSALIFNMIAVGLLLNISRIQDQ
ncbi:MAG: putative lipid II flippase FtsW [Candidatus Omnitrophica bacterium]|nr:putative lipid II flippase FtsW [Candidatus Omnitrophota bacterium]